MKKFISLLLVLVFVLSLSTVAFATDGGDSEVDDPYDGKLNVALVVPKTYNIKNGTAPDETFTFKFVGKSYVNGDGVTVKDATIPPISPVTISFSSTDGLTATTDAETGAVTAKRVYKTVESEIDPEKYELGIYTYEVTEDAPNTRTAGVSYSTEKLYLVLYILRDEESNKNYLAAMHYQDASSSDKSTGFTNEYNSGSLTVGKEIEGNMADMTKEFVFTIAFTAPTGTEIRSDISSNSTEGTWSGHTYTISLGDGETVTLSNIPAGTTYTVTENAQNYTSDGGVFSDGTKTISANDQDTVTFTNTLTKDIDTGITMDSVPYILLLAVACVGLVLFFVKKRSAREY